jgi:hypothetical protein
MAAPCQPLEERVDPVLELGLRNDPPIHHVGLDEQGRHITGFHERPPVVCESRGDGSATLDGVIYDPVGAVGGDHVR